MEALKIGQRGEGNGDESTKGPVICVQLPEEVLHEVSSAIGETPILTFAFLDQKKIEDALGTAQAVICIYDGPQGMARRFTPAIRRADKNLPVFMVIPAQFQGDEISQKDFKVSTAFHWPRDSARFTAAVYDVLNEETEDSGDGEASQLSGFELSEICRIARLDELKPPPRLSDHAILEHARQEVVQRQKASEQMRKLKEVNPHFFIGRTIVFHPDPAGAEGLRRHLRSGGLPNSIGASTISAAFHLLRSENITCVVVWYDGERDIVVEFIEELNAARSLRPVAVIVLTPGENAMGRFAHQTQELVYDSAMIYDKSPGQMVKSILAGLKHHRSAESVSGNLFKVRSVCRHAIPGTKRRPMDPEVLTQLLQPLRNSPGRGYWADAEELLQALLRRDGNAAADISAKLGTRKLDALILAATVKVLSEGGAAAGAWLVEKAVNHRQLNLERSYVIGRNLLSWKAAEPLSRFLLEWYNREDLPVDHQFDYIISGYFGLTKDSDMQIRFLARAIKAAPLRDEYLYSLLSYFRAKKDDRRLEDTWRVLLMCPGPNHLAVKYHLAKTLVDRSKLTEARPLLSDVLKLKPSFKPARVLLDKIGEG